MSVVLRVCLAVLAAVAATWDIEPTLAQSPVGVDIDDPIVEAGLTGHSMVFLPSGVELDAFELELQYDPAAVRIEQIEPAGNWQIIPQTTEVDRNGVIRVAGFSTGDGCASGVRCDLLVLTYAGRENAPAGFRVAEVMLLRSGVTLDAVSLRLGTEAEPEDTLPGERPSPSLANQPAAGSGGTSLGTVVLWLFIIATGLVAASSAIVAGSRWLWNRGGAPSRSHDPPDVHSNEEWDGVEGFLERVARLGSYSLDTSAPTHDDDDSR